MRRSERFASRERRELRRELLISPYPELGLVAMDGPNDPEPGLEVEDGRVVAMDGRRAEDFDVIDRFVARYGLDLDVAPEAAALADDEIARRLVDVDVPRAELVRLSRGLTPARLARVVSLLDPVEMMFALKKLRARRAPANQAHVTNLKENPALLAADAAEAARARLRRGRDDGRRLALRAAERDRDPGRLADRAPGGDDPVRGRGAAQPPARDPGARHLRRDALGVRDGAGLRRRRRHAVVEGLPRLGLRLPRREGALHLRRRLRGADGPRRRAARCSTSRPAAWPRSAPPAPRACRTGRSRASRSCSRCPAACARSWPRTCSPPGSTSRSPRETTRSRRTRRSARRRS